VVEVVLITERLVLVQMEVVMVVMEQIKLDITEQMVLEVVEVEQEQMVQLVAVMVVMEVMEQSLFVSQRVLFQSQLKPTLLKPLLVQIPF